jgi:hypothetical protein
MWAGDISWTQVDHPSLEQAALLPSAALCCCHLTDNLYGQRDLSTILLTTPLFEKLLKRSAPVNMRTVKVLRRSQM